MATLHPRRQVPPRFVKWKPLSASFSLPFLWRGWSEILYLTNKRENHQIGIAPPQSQVQYRDSCGNDSSRLARALEIITFTVTACTGNRTTKNYSSAKKMRTPKPHHLIYGTLKDYLTGEELTDTDD
jgi:hypothetical protein